MAKPDFEKKAAFTCAYAELDNATQAALWTGVTKSSTRRMDDKWLRDKRVVAMIREAMEDRLKALEPLTIKVIKDIMLSEHASPRTRLQAARNVLDRLGWVPPRPAEVVPMHQLNWKKMTLDELEEFVSGHRGVGLDAQSLQLVACND
jgi:phage terminase small subunit